MGPWSCFHKSTNYQCGLLTNIEVVVCMRFFLLACVSSRIHAHLHALLQPKNGENVKLCSPLCCLPTLFSPSQNVIFSRETRKNETFFLQKSVVEVCGRFPWLGFKLYGKRGNKVMYYSLQFPLCPFELFIDIFEKRNFFLEYTHNTGYTYMYAVHKYVVWIPCYKVWGKSWDNSAYKVKYKTGTWDLNRNFLHILT